MTTYIAAHIAAMKGRRAQATIDKRERLLLHANQHIPGGLNDADEDSLLGYLAQWADKPWTYYTYDGHLRGYLQWRERRGYAPDPLAGIPRPAMGDSTPQPCSDEELALALTARPPFGRAIMLAAYLGLRCAEIAGADRNHVTGHRLRVQGKGRKVRVIPIPEHVRAALLAEPGPLLGGTYAASTLTGKQRDAWSRLGLPRGFHLHSARHWYATRLLEGGATLREVQTLLGHSSPVTTAGYTLVTDQGTARAADRLPRLTEHRPDPNRPVPSAQAA